MEQGWIKLYRSIREHWIWEDPIKLKWWLDILLQANHQDKKILLGNELMEVKRGSFHTSEVKLAERWKVDRKTVRKFLNLLQNDSMITVEKSKKGTTLNISNYKGFQGFSEDKKDNTVDNGVDNSMDNKVPTQWTTPSSDKSQISPTNNNDKECITMIKNEEEGKEGEENTPTPPPPTLSPIQEKILNQLGPVSYKTWIANTEIIEQKDKVIIIAPSNFAMATIRDRFKQKLEICLGKQIEVKEE